MISQSLVAIGIKRDIVGTIEDSKDFSSVYLIEDSQNISEEVGKIVTNRSTGEVIFLLEANYAPAAKVLKQRGYYVAISGDAHIEGVPNGLVRDMDSAYQLINQLGFSLSTAKAEEASPQGPIDIFELASLLEEVGSPKDLEEEKDLAKIQAIKDIANRSQEGYKASAVRDEEEEIAPLPPLDDDFVGNEIFDAITSLDDLYFPDEAPETNELDLDVLGAEEETKSEADTIIEQGESADEEVDFASLFAEFVSIPAFEEPTQTYTPPAKETPSDFVEGKEQLAPLPSVEEFTTAWGDIPDLENFNIQDTDDKLSELVNQYKIPLSPNIERPQPRRVTNRKAVIIAMFIAKGGTGKTSVSYSLAARLASVLSKNGNKRVAFLDANRGNADVAGYLGLDLTRVSTLSAIASEPFITEDVLARIIYKDPQYNLDVIFSPSEADDQSAKLVRVDLYREVTSVLAEKYDYIFIDTPAAPGITGPEDEMDARLFTEFILADANLLVGVITPSQPLINRTIKLFQVLTQPKYQGIGHGLDRSKIGVLLNRYKYTPGKGALSEEDIRSQLASWTWWGRIPEIDEWQNYINIGNSQVSNPQLLSYVDPILAKLTREPFFVDGEVSVEDKSPMFGKLFSRKKKG